MRRLAILGGALAMLAAACSGTDTPAPAPAPTTGRTTTAAAPLVARTDHPRLLVTPDDLPRLRSWATDDNPVYAEGLAPKVAQAEQLVADGTIPDTDSGLWSSYEPYPTESYAELFAFMSLVHPDRAKRDEYGELARRLLMYVVDKALPGPGGDEDPWTAFGFSTFNRSRWAGEGFGLTVDWAYPYFSDEDKDKIRTLFLRWSEEQFRAYPAISASGGAPDFSVDGPFEDTSLADGPAQVRWSTNNYFTGHLRNLTLMSLALDDADDPGGELHRYLENATGQWLYLTAKALRGDAAGGLSPEGSEYAASSLAYVVQTQLALRTAGREDTELGDFWDDFVVALFASLPSHDQVAPDPDLANDQGEAPTYQPATFGDLERYWAPDLVETLGPLGLLAAADGDQPTLDAARWYERHVPYGAEDSLYQRAGSSTDQTFGPILFFLLLDPDAAEPVDPRPDLPLVHDVEGLGVTLARTCWCPEARMLTFAATWRSIDHQGADALGVELARNGEWLTKKRTGYDLSIISDFQNTLSVQNDPIKDPDTDERWILLNQRGSQAFQVDGDPRVTARSEGDGYVYRAGDATPAYNASVLGADDVVQVTRDVMWLQPDHVVVYDRAETRTANRFKRVWFQTPTEATVAGDVATMRTPGGQQLVTTSLLPEDADVATEQAPSSLGNAYDAGPAIGEPMRFRIRIEAPGGPARTRFLTVLQGADGGAAADPATLVRSTAGTAYVGALVAGTLVLFPDDTGGATTVPLPSGTDRVLVTGLEPGSDYSASTSGGVLNVTAGGGITTDAGGVLDVEVSR